MIVSFVDQLITRWCSFLIGVMTLKLVLSFTTFTFIRRLIFLVPPLEALEVFLLWCFLLPVLKTDCFIASFSESVLVFVRFCSSTPATLRCRNKYRWKKYVQILVVPIKQMKSFRLF